MDKILRNSDDGFFGEYGGTYSPETLMPILEELRKAFRSAESDPVFMAEYNKVMREWAGRPTPLYLCETLSKEWGAEIYLKREDLLHGGAHKTNNALGQVLLAKRMGKTRIIAETGAGQHGVATAMAGARMGLSTVIYMGELDVERQAPNVQRMEMLGAKVVVVKSGGRALKDAINDAMRDWVATCETTHYVLGTVAGPHPFPTIVRFFQSVIGTEAKEQCLSQIGRLPDYAVACVGGGSNAMGLFSAFLDDKDVALVGAEPGGDGVETGRHGAVLCEGTMAVLHGMRSLALQNKDGQIDEPYSISAGLDYPLVGPEHVHLQDIKRATYTAITDLEALAAFHDLSRTEGILPALESSHALAEAKKIAARDPGSVILVSLSGRGDKDLEHIVKYEKEHGIFVSGATGEK
ncbi:MAG: tryptophan synthase subunit beta [Alphaproteobacteria bacterium]|nr:tryptophan synthase subunit beta [Alphaproteobacteria bacterium]